MLRETVAPLLLWGLHPIVSLLERLCAPSASEFGRKRKIDANSAPAKGKRSTQNLRKFDLKSV